MVLDFTRRRCKESNWPLIIRKRRKKTKFGCELENEKVQRYENAGKGRKKNEQEKDDRDGWMYGKLGKIVMGTERKV